MKELLLSSKITLVSGLVLVILGLASFGILYRAQTQLVTQEMDDLLTSETLALSAMVSSKPDGGFEFEMSRAFLSQYQQIKPSGFFRFVEPRDHQILRESLGAPPVSCETGKLGVYDLDTIDHRIFRIKASTFFPEIDSESKEVRAPKPSSVCLVVGVDEARYKALVVKTLFSTIPLLLLLVGALIGILLFLVRRLTGDLSKLTVALETADFGATHEFPKLPEAHTIEVRAVGKQLVALHTQAADVYRDMWLFLGRAAHQLKTPVAAMQATLQVLLRKERSKEELLSGLADVEAAAGQLAGLTKQLIASSRMSYQEAPNKEVIELHHFLTDQARAFTSQAEQRGVSIRVESTATLKVRANASLLFEVFGNLIENAILYSPTNRGAVVSISWVVDHQKTIILVSDQGKGFPAQVREFLFEPFVRGDEREIPGSGLGLSIAKKSVQLLGGDITLKKTDQTGSTIAVTLLLA